MKLTISYGEGAFSLPEAMLSYLDKADPLALKLFLLLSSDRTLREDFSVTELARSYAVTEGEIEAALTFWVNAGLLSRSDGEEKKNAPKKISVAEKSLENGEKVTVVTSGMPNYTGKEIEAIMQGDPALSALIADCQSLAGKVFGAHEISRLLGMADYLRLSHESILLLFAYAARLEKCSVAYVEKIAASLVNEGMSDYQSIEAYIEGKDKQRTLESAVRSLAGIQGRAFSAKEKKFIAKWCELDISDELLTLAYEITVDNTGSFSFPYMNKVLLNWREAGYTTADEVKNATERYRENKKDAAGDASFNVNEFFEAALKRSQAVMEDARKGK